MTGLDFVQVIFPAINSRTNECMFVSAVVYSTSSNLMLFNGTCYKRLPGTVRDPFGIGGSEMMLKTIITFSEDR